jgi:hypothetical protein
MARTANCVQIFQHIYCVFKQSDWLMPPRGLPPYREEEVCAPQWPEDLCWRERKLLVEPPVSDRSKGKVQMKCSPWSSRLGLGLTTPLRKKLLLWNLQRKEPWRRPRPIQGCSASKEENWLMNSWYIRWRCSITYAGIQQYWCWCWQRSGVTKVPTEVYYFIVIKIGLYFRCTHLLYFSSYRRFVYFFADWTYLSQVHAYIHTNIPNQIDIITWLSDYRRGLDSLLDLLDTSRTCDYTSEITITHRPVFSVTLISNGFQRRTFFWFRAHVLAGLRPSHANLGLLVSSVTSFI